MTTVELEKALQMRMEGQTYAQIGEALHYSRQHICNTLQTVAMGCKSRGRTRRACRDIYPRLAQWMVEHDCSYTRLAELTGASYGAISNLMRGCGDPSKRLIDNILAATGLTYEQAFGGGKP